MPEPRNVHSSNFFLVLTHPVPARHSLYKVIFTWIFACIFLKENTQGIILLGGGRIRDVASLIRRTDEPKIKIFFWGEKSKKTFSPEAKIFF